LDRAWREKKRCNVGFATERPPPASATHNSASVMSWSGLHGASTSSRLPQSGAIPCHRPAALGKTAGRSSLRLPADGGLRCHPKPRRSRPPAHALNNRCQQTRPQMPVPASSPSQHCESSFRPAGNILAVQTGEKTALGPRSYTIRCETISLRHSISIAMKALSSPPPSATLTSGTEIGS
jgi:hypothetical protein